MSERIPSNKIWVLKGILRNFNTTKIGFSEMKWYTLIGQLINISLERGTLLIEFYTDFTFKLADFI